MIASRIRARLKELVLTGCSVWSAGTAGELKME
jgi:hypothetical protein